MKGRCPRPLDDGDNIVVLRCYEFFGGDKQDRTADLLHAMQALSQLSYTPTWKDRNYSRKLGHLQSPEKPPELGALSQICRQSGQHFVPSEDIDHRIHARCLRLPCEQYA